MPGFRAGMDKNEILTTYLNVSPFGRNNRGQNIAGVEAAAQRDLWRLCKDLSVPQAAFIAGLPQSPIVYSPYAADGSLKSKENLRVRSGACQKTFCSICTGREPCRKRLRDLCSVLT